MNKKGFLLGEETLKIMLAVICIGFLAFLLFSIYGARNDAVNLEFAKESLNFLSQEINAEKISVEIYNPKGWNIGVWPHDVETGLPMFKKTESQYPKFCSNLGWEECICICEENNDKSCNNNGICVNNEKNLKINEGNIEIKNPPITLNIDYLNNKISEA